MGVPQGKPIEQYPHDLVAPAVWLPLHMDAFTYRVQDGDSWESVAATFFLDPKELIHYNFLTINPDEVNWYLHFYVGCKEISDSGNNWKFSGSAHPGIIFIPPADHDPIDADPLEICAWGPDSAQKFLKRLIEVAATIRGDRADRIKRLLSVIVAAGYPRCRELWYYNSLSVLHFVDFHTNEAMRRKMTLATVGHVPFDGRSGVEGAWRIRPVADMMDEFVCRFDPKRAKESLLWMEDQMWQGWHSMELALAQSSQGGGSGFGQDVSDFISHVNSLSEDKTSLYWAFP